MPAKGGEKLAKTIPVVRRGNGKTFRLPLAGIAVGEAQGALQVGERTRGRRAHVGLRHNGDVGNLGDARFHELQRVSRGRLNAKHNRIGHRGDIGFRLPDAHALDDDPIVKRAEQRRSRKSDICEPAKPPARGDGADEHAVIFRVGAHAHAVAEQRAAARPRRRIDGHHRHGLPRRRAIRR